MRPAARLALVLLPLVSILACGGRFDGNVPTDGGSSSSSGGSSGGGSGSSSGGQGCPAPANVQSTGACSPNGLTCPTDQTITDCNGNPGQPLTCVCESGQWICEHSGPGCPPPVCPAPRDVAPLAGCKLPPTLTCDSATPYYDCTGNVAGYLQCNCYGGQWKCPQPPTVCPVDASTGCPDPASIQAGTPCNAPNVTCPGNPTVCNGQTDYDAFQCENGYWVDVARTVCDVDASAGD
jgi:hypothetical protein